MLDEDVVLMDWRLPVSEVNEVLNLNLLSKEFHTVGGLVMARLRHIPREGGFIVEPGYRFTVVQPTEPGTVKLWVEREGHD